eukprot:TRINITY_DN5421_c0_g1_i1.p1 TRINITY_DN5421_c0_g1~~TRINITY_DN5421_c0_g1_i1.p1  ORF type:complete len:254 (+),score=52.91 TRINITY_DN5421_c0_g1_i1:371-1132(+)
MVFCLMVYYIFVENIFFGNRDIEADKREIFSKIAEHLSKCPKSLIVVDEVEYIHPQVIAGLAPFMDDSLPHVSFNGKTAPTHEATIILVSDFGTEATTAGMSSSQIEELVAKDCLKFWVDPKHTHLINHIIPFMPLDKSAIKELMEARLDNIHEISTITEDQITRVDYNVDVLHWLATHAIERYNTSFGRGAENFFREAVLSKLVQKLEMEEEKPACVAHLQVIKSTDKLAVRLQCKEQQKKDTKIIEEETEL